MMVEGPPAESVKGGVDTNAVGKVGRERRARKKTWRSKRFGLCEIQQMKQCSTCEAHLEVATRKKKQIATTSIITNMYGSKEDHTYKCRQKTRANTARVQQDNYGRC